MATQKTFRQLDVDGFVSLKNRVLVDQRLFWILKLRINDVIKDGGGWWDHYTSVGCGGCILAIDTTTRNMWNFKQRYNLLYKLCCFQCKWRKGNQFLIIFEIWGHWRLFSTIEQEAIEEDMVMISLEKFITS
jgi:hypothetical protein